MMRLKSAQTLDRTPKHHGTAIFIAVLALVCVIVPLAGCQEKSTESPPPVETVVPADNTTSSSETTAILYENTDYGFRFPLPDSWKGYTVVTDKWEGLSTGDPQGEKIVETGPKVSIRHPEWTAENPRQDIPILVFTLEQWNAMHQENGFHIGAAPIEPSELGRNAKYVFALPARYNFAFPTGYEEVEALLKGHPLQPN